MKSLLKITLLLIIIFGIFAQLNICYAKIFDDTSKSIEGQLEEKKPPELGDEPELINIGSVITSAIRVVGVIVSVVALMGIGIKTMFGSVEERSKYKEVLPGYIIGVILVLAMTSLPSFIYEVTQKSIT